jgi:membrane protein YqaA with SNARE-associated domain
MIYALGGLFLWSFLAATVLPLSSEVPLAGYVRSYNQIIIPVLIATTGNYLGACTTYWLARKDAGAFDKTRELQENNSRAARMIRRFGQPSLLLSWVPIIGDAIVAIAGGLKMDFKMFSLWTATGKLLRYAAVAWAASAII